MVSAWLPWRTERCPPVSLLAAVLGLRYHNEVIRRQSEQLVVHMQPSLAMSTPEQNVPTTTAAKTQRVLACVLCQQRKIKCDRVFPCAHCVKAHVQCVPANLIPRQRRRRYLERELLERLDRYESLLRQNNIHFAPLHKDYVSGGSRNLVRATSGDQYDSANREQQPLQAEPSSSRLESVFEAKYACAVRL